MDVDLDENDSNSSDGEATSAPVPHDALWFGDGNVVLATGNYLFRVHKGVLSLQSSVFRDMFELPTVDGSNLRGEHGAGMVPELYEGLPLVTLAGDKGDDVVHLLRAAYERRCVFELCLRFHQYLKDKKYRYYDRYDYDGPVEKVIALLLLSKKYDFADIQRDVMKQLIRLCPTTLHEYETLQKPKKDEHDIPEYTFEYCRPDFYEILLIAAFSANVTVLLPTLYYANADAAIQYYFNDVQDFLDPRCLEVLLCGNEALAADIRSVLSSCLLKCVRCVLRHRRGEFIGIPELYGSDDLPNTSNISRITWEALEKSFPTRVCSKCKADIKKSMVEERLRIWDKIPSYFELPDWEKIREDAKAYK